MRPSLLALLSTALLSAHAARIELRQSIPACATTCLATAVAASTCSATNIACLCADPAFTKAAATCVEAQCSASDVQNALAGAQEFCAAVSVTLNPTSLTAGLTPSGGASATESGTTTPALGPGPVSITSAVSPGASSSTAASLTSAVVSGAASMSSASSSSAAAMSSMTSMASASANTLSSIASAASTATVSTVPTAKSAASSNFRAPTALAGFFALLGLAVAL